MNLDNLLTLLQIVSIVVLMPLGAFRAWRKLDERLTEQDTKLARIEYALFNDGRGIEQQVKEIHKNQQTVITDMAVLKAIKL